MASIPLVMRVNAASCIGFGLLFVLLPTQVAIILGGMPPIVLIGVGLVLIINGGHLVLSSLRATPNQAEILWFSFGDLSWWLASLLLIAANLWITAMTGIVIAMLVAFYVAVIGVTQLFLLGMARTGLSAGAHWQQIGRSWLALPGWVKVWLFSLNALFLVSPFLLPWEAARVVILAYVATGPLLLGFAFFEGGLTRAMGVAHIIPWLPLLVWLSAVESSLTMAPLQSGFFWLLASTMAICLAFDFYDLARWFRGERTILTR